jgi:ligand-binding sensor domain-containing protein/signal transduction histidine kinase
MFSLRSLAASTLALTLLVTLGLPAELAVGGYSIRSWHTEDGLPTNTLSSALQTRDGYMWFGTYAGLARFDGESFHDYNAGNTPALEDGRISCLFEDSHGTLWIGHETGVITRYHNGRFEDVTLRPQAAREKVTAIGSDENGRIWAMRLNGGVDALDDTVQLPSLIAPELPAIMSWTRNAQGNIWISENGQLARLTDSKLAVMSITTDNRPNYVLCAAPSASGGAWLVCAGEGIRRWRDGQWVEDRGKYPAPPGSISCCLELRDGTFALGTIYSGLYLMFKDGRPPVHFDQTNGLPQNWVRFLYEDREGNLWIGSGSAGLAAIHQSPFSVLNSPDQWQGRTVISVAPGRDNSLWIGTEGNGIYNYSNQTWTHYGEAEGLANQYVWAVNEDPAGQVWAGYYWWGGPFRLVDGRFVRPDQVDTRSAQVLALETSSTSGEVLVGNRDGLMRLAANGSTWLYKSEPGTSADVCAVVRDQQGIIWFGMAQGGLGRVVGEKVSIFRRKDGLSSDAIQCLLADPKSGALWIGTADGGLTRLKNGKFSQIGTSQGLVDNAICHLLDDDFGYLWLSTRHGIMQIDKAELNRCADGLQGWIWARIYDQSYGLPTLEFTGGRQGAGCKTTDGRLWFCCSKGLVTVDPSRIPSNPTPPPIIIDSFTVDAASVAFSGGAVAATLRPDHERLEIHYAGLSFVAVSRVLFNYKLEGVDKDWVPAGDRRTAYYSHLPAGSYRFRVIGCNDEGVWNKEGATLTFTVAPFFWQTWWFRGFCTLAALSTVAWLVRFLTRRRMLQRLVALERLHAIERERARIARDIHDDLGGNLTRIAILSQPAPEKIREPHQAAKVLSGIYMVAHDGIRALDEIVWAVDPQHDTLDSLVSYMGEYAQDFLEAANIRCFLDFPIDLPPWPLGAETRHNLFLAFKETLNNTIKHSAATEVRISLSLQPNAFVLAVKDNGRGFDPRLQPSANDGRITGGHGLPNLERRLAAIGGRCEIKTSTSEGTLVAFIVAVPAENPRSGPRLV